MVVVAGQVVALLQVRTVSNKKVKLDQVDRSTGESAAPAPFVTHYNSESVPSATSATSASRHFQLISV